MTRAAQFTIATYLIAVPIAGYLCVFPELAVLAGIFLAALVFVAPVLVLSYLGCRYLGPSPVRSNDPAAALPDQRPFSNRSLGHREDLG